MDCDKYRKSKIRIRYTHTFLKPRIYKHVVIQAHPKNT